MQIFVPQLENTLSEFEKNGNESCALLMWSKSQTLVKNNLEVVLDNDINPQYEQNSYQLQNSWNERVQQTATFAVFQADLTKTRSVDSLQFLTKITNPKYVDTDSWWGWRVGRRLQSAMATRHSDRIAFPFLLSILSSSRLNKRPPRQREMILGDSWVSCFLIQAPHFAELSGKKKTKNTEPPPPAQPTTWELLSSKPQAVECLAPQVCCWATAVVASGNFRQFLMSEGTDSRKPWIQYFCLGPHTQARKTVLKCQLATS